MLGLVLLALLAGCDVLGFGSWSWNQRLALEIETPEGVKQMGAWSPFMPTEARNGFREKVAAVWARGSGERLRL